VDPETTITIAVFFNPRNKTVHALSRLVPQLYLQPTVCNRCM